MMPPTPSSLTALAGRRIAIIQCSCHLGGAERQGLHAAELLHRFGADVRIFAMESPGALAERCVELGVSLTVIPRVESRFGAVACWRLWRAAGPIRRWRPEILVPYTNPANVLAGWLAAWGVCPALWNQRDEGLLPMPRLLENLACGACSAWIANGPATVRALERRHPGRPVREIPNAVVLAPARSGPDHFRAAWGARPHQPVVAMVANLTPNKDHATLLDAWAEVASHPDQPILVLAGSDGGSARGVADRIASEGLPRVHIVGHVADIGGFLGAVDIAVLSSRSEGSPNGVLEPMAAGLPVIATFLPATVPLLDPDDLVPPGDGAALASRLAFYLDHPAARQGQGARNRAHIARHHGSASGHTRLAELLIQILPPSRSPR